MGQPLVTQLGDNMGKKNRYKELPTPRNTAFNNSLRKNTNTYYFWFYRMCELYMNRLVFEDVPSTIDIPTLQYGLLFNGNVCYFNDDILGNLCLMGVPSREVDVYNYQIGYYIHTASGYNRHLRVSRFDPNRNGVVIYANQMRQADISIIMDYAERFYEILRSADVNIANQKTMKIFQTTEAQRLTLENLLKNYSGNVPLTLVDKTFNLQGEDGNMVIDMTSPYVADKLWTYLTNLWNDFLTWAGFENANNQKRERLVEDEVNSNYGNVEISRRAALAMPEIAVREINELFGTNIKVRFNSQLPTMLNKAFIGGDNGDLYDSDTGIGRLSDEEPAGGDELFPEG